MVTTMKERLAKNDILEDMSPLLHFPKELLRNLPTGEGSGTSRKNRSRLTPRDRNRRLDFKKKIPRYCKNEEDSHVQSGVPALVCIIF